MIAKLILATVATLAATQVQAQTPRIVMEEMMVPSDPGIEIYVRNKRLADMTAFRPERTVLYVHGATYPASTAFDLEECRRAALRGGGRAPPARSL